MSSVHPPSSRPRPRFVIGFDADDTLWHNETTYRQASERFAGLLSEYVDPARAHEVLSEVEVRNISRYGYGFKSYVLSMIEAAISVTDERAPATVISAILEIGRGMLEADLRLFEHASATLHGLAADHDLMLVTKGDLLEQSKKLERSGLAGMFRHIEIVQDKTPTSYRQLLERHGIAAGNFLMVGNSLKSDVLPVLEIGGRAVFIPYEHTWAHEHADGAGYEYYEIADLSQLPDLIAGIDA